MTDHSKRTRVGVVGVGHLGKQHLHHLLQIPHAECVGFHDIDSERSRLMAATSGAHPFSSLKELIDASEAVLVVVPTGDHFPVAEACIEGGRHVFLEKPMCETVSEADRLLALAKRKSVLIQVGHIERLNPALLALDEIPVQPKYIESHRLASYSVRGTDVPVVLDLMIHDLDVIMSLVKSPVKSVHASGVSIMTKSVDVANARLRFENGCVANITSSRIAKTSVRKLRIFQQEMYVTIDFLLGLTEVYRILDGQDKDPSAVVTAPLDQDGSHRQIVYEKPEVRNINALRFELENFVESVQGDSRPIVSGEEGREALRIAILVQEQIEQDIH
ncbi:MAG: Gfo/Idh/MocA family oxidoreductase [Candidatus Neomarinimicrobiota bacterium]